MAIPSVYINLEDDVSKIVTRLKHNSAKQVVLVCPKRCFLFSDSINLRLLKKQTDLLGKEIFILTMDEKGQAYAKEAGFGLKYLSRSGGSSALSDIKTRKKPPALTPVGVDETSNAGILGGTLGEIKNFAKKLSSPVIQSTDLEAEADEYVPPRKSKAPIKQEVKVTDAFFPEITQDLPVQEENSKSRTRKAITGLVALVLIVVIFLVLVILPKATVEIYPRTEPVTRDMEISMSVNTTAPDPSKLIMPAYKVDESVNVNGSFQSQGKMQVGNKATGTVKIYNFTKLPLNLKASTTILTVGSKNYNLVSDVADLKPTLYSNKATKEVDPSSLGASVSVIAAQGGEDYNLPAGTRMEITNQVFGSRPQLLYAETDSEVTGGTTRYLSVISQSDVTAAQAQLQLQALGQIRDKLKTSGLVLPEQSYAFSVPQFSTDNAVGSQTPTFQATLQAHLTGLAYKQDDLNNLITQRITETLNTDKTLQPQTPDSTSVAVKTYDPVNQVAVLSVHYQGQAVFDVNLPNIGQELVGKTESQANEILRSKSEIDTVNITLAPVWQKNFPFFANKIKVIVEQAPAPGQ